MEMDTKELSSTCKHLALLLGSYFAAIMLYVNLTGWENVDELLLEGYSSQRPPWSPVVNLKRQGPLRGNCTAKVCSWRGIPFAAPPVGDLRWRPPHPVMPWGPTTLDATSFKPMCAQPNTGGDPSTGATYNGMPLSEDCLYLNVFVPKMAVLDKAVPLDTDFSMIQRFPVMLYIHGGDFTYGGASYSGDNSPADAIAAGESFQKWANGDASAIVVTVQYRLGIFGFLGSNALRSRDPEGSTGNYGLQDQRAAMQWVREHISSFGGDPRRVMIFGQSAGAASVAAHLVAQRSWGLYHAAVMESGGFQHWNTVSMAQGEHTFALMANRTGCGAPLLANVDTVDCLLTAEAPLLANLSMGPASYSTSHSMDGLANEQWGPVIDGVELQQPLRRALQRGEVNEVPTILGSNRDDGGDFLGYLKTGQKLSESLFYEWTYTTSSFQTWALDTFGPAAVQPLTELYHPNPAIARSDPFMSPNEGIGLITSSIHNDDDSATNRVKNRTPDWYWSAVWAVTDYMMRCPTEQAARQMRKQNWKVWVYEFACVSYAHGGMHGGRTFNDSWWVYDEVGAGHTAELPFVFQDRSIVNNTVDGDGDGAFSFNGAEGGDGDGDGHGYAQPQLQAQTDLMVMMGRYWMQMASAGDPNGSPARQVAPLTTWPMYSADTHDAKIMSFRCPGSKVEQQDSKFCAFWDGYYKLEEQHNCQQVRCQNVPRKGKKKF